jgi:phospholipase C
MTTTAKMTAIAEPILFSIGTGKDYYLVRFTRENLPEGFSHRDVKECLKAAGHTPADVREGDEILTHPEITNRKGWVGLFGTFSNNPRDEENVAFFNPRIKHIWRYHQDVSNGNLPHPVLCCK